MDDVYMCQRTRQAHARGQSHPHWVMQRPRPGPPLWTLFPIKVSQALHCGSDHLLVPAGPAIMMNHHD